MKKKKPDSKDHDDENLLQKIEEDSKHRKSALLKILENATHKKK